MNDRERSERAVRKEYLALLNTVVYLVRRILERESNWNSRGLEDYLDLQEMGTVTTLKQVKKLEDIGWRLGDMGGTKMIAGNALVLVAEMYGSRFPIDKRAMDEARERIEELTRDFRLDEPGGLSEGS